MVTVFSHSKGQIIAETTAHLSLRPPAGTQILHHSNHVHGLMERTKETEKMENGSIVVVSS